jgi:hypothetical protein
VESLIGALLLMVLSVTLGFLYWKKRISNKVLEVLDKMGSVLAFVGSVVLLLIHFAFISNPQAAPPTPTTTITTVMVSATSAPSSTSAPAGSTANNNTSSVIVQAPVQGPVNNTVNNYTGSTATPKPTSTITPTPTSTPMVMYVGQVFHYADKIPGGLCGYGKLHSLVKDGVGLLHIYLNHDQDPETIYESISKDGGKTWNKPVPILTLVPPGNFQGLSCSVAEDHNGGIQLVADLTGADVAYTRFENGSWREPKHRGRGLPDLGAWSADLAVGPTDNVLITWSSQRIWDTFFDGQNWSSEAELSPGGWHPDVFIDQANHVHIVFNTGNLIGSFNDQSSVNTYYIYSEDWIHWREESIVNPLNNHWHGAAAIVVDPKGHRHVTYIEQASLEGDLYYVESDDGQSWSDPKKLNMTPGVQTGTDGNESASMTMDPWGNVYVVWKGLDDTKPNAVYHIYVRMLDINRNVWSDPFDLGTACASVGCHPTVAYQYLDSPSNQFNLDVAWTDVGGIRFARVLFQTRQP